MVSASAAAAVVGFLADTWPVVRRSSQRRDVKPFWRAQPTQADGPGFFESTSTSCVPLYATEPADETADEPACHARRIREECGKRKAEIS